MIILQKILLLGHVLFGMSKEIQNIFKFRKKDKNVKHKYVNYYQMKLN